MLFIWNVELVVLASTGLSASTAAVLDTSDIKQFFAHLKSSSISQLIKDKSRDFQKLFKYFNGTTASTSNLLLLADVLPIIFVLCLKDLLFVV